MTRPTMRGLIRTRYTCPHCGGDTRVPVSPTARGDAIEYGDGSIRCLACFTVRPKEVK